MKGTSTKCSETTPVVLKSAPHKTHTKPQSSLPLTPGLPVDGKPCECKQEAADSNVTAGHMNGMVQLAKPTEIVNVDLEKAVLGGEPAERASRVDKGSEMDPDVDRTTTLGRDPTTACGVDEGDEMEREAQLWLKELKLLCGEIIQHSGIANKDIPSVQKLPLEGEWTVCMSSELLTMTVELYTDDGDGNACVYLGGTRWHAGDASRPKGQSDGSGCQSDVSRGQTDEARGQTYVLSQSNNAKTDRLDHGEGAGTYLGTGDPKRPIQETDGNGIHADVLSGHGDIPSIEMNANKPADAGEIIRIPRKKEKPPDITLEAAWQHSDEPNGFGDATDASSVLTDGPSVETEMEMPANVRRNVRTP